MKKEYENYLKKKIENEKKKVKFFTKVTVTLIIATLYFIFSNGMPIVFVLSGMIIEAIICVYVTTVINCWLLIGDVDEWRKKK